MCQFWNDPNVEADKEMAEKLKNLGEPPVTEDVRSFRYRCHKEVSALTISKVFQSSGLGATVWFEETPGNGMYLPPEMFARYSPVPGDYLMFYDDGYKSFSPKKAFEEGYTRI